MLPVYPPGLRGRSAVEVLDGLRCGGPRFPGPALSSGDAMYATGPGRPTWLGLPLLAREAVRVGATSDTYQTDAAPLHTLGFSVLARDVVPWMY